MFVNSTNVVMNYSEIESKVREATSDDPWGPSGQLMGEIAKYVKLSVHFHYNQIKSILEGHIKLHELYRHHNIFDCVFVYRSTFMYEQFPEVMNMLWTRMLKDNKKNWRRVYKVSLQYFCSSLACIARAVLSCAAVVFCLFSIHYSFIQTPTQVQYLHY